MCCVFSESQREPAYWSRQSLNTPSPVETELDLLVMRERARRGIRNSGYDVSHTNSEHLIRTSCFILICCTFFCDPLPIHKPQYKVGLSWTRVYAFEVSEWINCISVMLSKAWNAAWNQIIFNVEIRRMKSNCNGCIRPDRAVESIMNCGRGFKHE